MTEELLLFSKTSCQVVHVSCQCHSLRCQVFDLALVVDLRLMPVRRTSQVNSRPQILPINDNFSQVGFLAARLQIVV